MYSPWKTRSHGYAGANFLIVDKAVNYILGQPDGKLLETISTVVLLLIHPFFQLTKTD